MSYTTVCHLTTLHQANDVRIYHKEILTLVKAGYAVTLVAPATRDEFIPDPGVRWIALPPPRNRFDRATRLALAAYRAALASEARIVHLHDPELLFVGLLLKLHGKKVVWDAHEDLPAQIRSKHWIPALLRGAVSRIVDLLERSAARFFDAVVAATPPIAKRFPFDKVTVVQNYPVSDELYEINPLPYNERPPWVVYMGGVSVIRGAREMLKAMELLPDKSGARLVLAGRFSPASLEEELRQFPGWTRVDFQGWLQRSSVAGVLGKVRAGLVLFHPEPNHVEAQPNKLFEYMAAGIPVIASDFPPWRKIVEGEGCGLLVNPLDPQEIAQAIHWVLTHPKEAAEMGRRGQQAVRERYNWDVETPKLLALYERLSE